METRRTDGGPEGKQFGEMYASVWCSLLWFMAPLSEPVSSCFIPFSPIVSLLTWFILRRHSPSSSVAHACFALSCFVRRRKAEAVKVKCTFVLYNMQTPLWCLFLCLFHCDDGQGLSLCVTVCVLRHQSALPPLPQVNAHKATDRHPDSFSLFF